jgi:ferrochelatase
VSNALPPYDSLLLVSFGGPEGPDDVLPFLENVLRGKNVPRERMLEVAEHYHHFGGISPINEQNRQLIAALEGVLREAGIELPIYWGNRNWHPMLEDTLRQMRNDGRRRALAFFTSTFSCYSGCRQYRENIAAAQKAVGEGAPLVEKIRMGFNHPGFVNAMADRVRTAATQLREEDASAPRIVFTAHSIPLSMSDNSDYEKQLRESCRLVAEAAGIADWVLVFQSRSGPPQQPWLEPDICDYLETERAAGTLPPVIITPIGFVSDHMEVMFDLDEEAAELCREKGIPMSRAATVGTHSAFLAMIVELIRERLDPALPREALGPLGPWHDVCPSNCCLYPSRRPAVAQASTSDRTAD